jgi:hypothetical protein
MHDRAKEGEGDDEWSWEATRALATGYVNNQSYHSTSFPGKKAPLRDIHVPYRYVRHAF